MLKTLSPARRRFTLVLCALAVVAVIVGLVAVVRSRQETVVPVSQTELGPVLLVPGYGGSTSALEVMAAAMKAQGRVVEIVSPVGDGTGDLRDQAAALDLAATAAVEKTGAGSVDVVGYSAGGVVARLWVSELGGGSIARRVVSIGSPQHGTDVAGFAEVFAPQSCPTACQQLATDSDLMRELNADDETPDGPLWISMWTTNDQLVLPPQSAALDGAVNFSIQQICGDLTIEHGDLPRTPEVIALTIFELGRTLPSEPTARSC